MPCMNLLDTEPLHLPCLLLHHLASQGIMLNMAAAEREVQGCTDCDMPCNLQVLGLEQFSAVAHDKGSSHGSSRIIRLQYHEHPDYVPLLHRAYELWHDLEVDSGKVMGNQIGFSSHLLQSMCHVHT